jgi:hypothetical protein
MRKSPLLVDGRASMGETPLSGTVHHDLEQRLWLVNNLKIVR